MQLVHIKNTNARSSTNTITLGSSGLIAFSVAASEMLQLEKGVKLMFLQDKDRPKDWYLNISDDGDSCPRKYKDNMFCFNASGLARTIKKSLDADEKKSLKIALGEPFDNEGQTLIALLTAKI